MGFVLILSLSPILLVETVKYYKRHKKVILKEEITFLKWNPFFRS